MKRVNNLGAIFESDLNVESHVRQVSKVRFYHLNETGFYCNALLFPKRVYLYFFLIAMHPLLYFNTLFFHFTFYCTLFLVIFIVLFTVLGFLLLLTIFLLHFFTLSTKQPLV